MTYGLHDHEFRAQLARERSELLEASMRRARRQPRPREEAARPPARLLSPRLVAADLCARERCVA